MEVEEERSEDRGAPDRESGEAEGRWCVGEGDGEAVRECVPSEGLPTPPAPPKDSWSAAERGRPDRLERRARGEPTCACACA